LKETKRTIVFKKWTLILQLINRLFAVLHVFLSAPAVDRYTVEI